MRYLLTSLLVAAFFVSSTASAQRGDDALARSFFESGRAYFDRAEYDEAARAFAEAYRLSHRPALLLNQARALDEADRTEEAIAILEQAEREIPQTETQLHEEVDQRLTRLRLELERQRARQAAEVPVPAAEVPETVVVPEPDEPNTSLIVGLVSGGSGVAMLAVALGTGLAANGVQDRLDSNCPNDVCPAEYADDVTHGQRLARTSTAMTFLGVGALGVAIPFMIRGLRHGDEDEPRVALTGGPGQIGSGVRVRF